MFSFIINVFHLVFQKPKPKISASRRLFLKVFHVLLPAPWKSWTEMPTKSYSRIYIFSINFAFSGRPRCHFVCVSDQTAEEGHDSAGQWEATQKRRTRENPLWESASAPNVRHVFAGSTGIYHVAERAVHNTSLMKHPRSEICGWCSSIYCPAKGQRRSLSFCLLLSIALSKLSYKLL